MIDDGPASSCRPHASDFNGAGIFVLWHLQTLGSVMERCAFVLCVLSSSSCVLDVRVKFSCSFISVLWWKGDFPGVPCKSDWICTFLVLVLLHLLLTLSHPLQFIVRKNPFYWSCRVSHSLGFVDSMLFVWYTFPCIFCKLVIRSQTSITFKVVGFSWPEGDVGPSIKRQCCVSLSFYDVLSHQWSAQIC